MSFLEIKNVEKEFGPVKVLRGVNLAVDEHQVVCLIGASGCGKSTLLRCINRMNDEIPGARVTKGSIRIGNIDINDPSVDVVKLRRDVGMVFQKSNPFPSSIYENVA